MYGARWWGRWLASGRLGGGDMWGRAGRRGGTELGYLDFFPVQREQRRPLASVAEVQGQRGWRTVAPRCRPTTLAPAAAVYADRHPHVDSVEGQLYAQHGAVTGGPGVAADWVDDILRGRQSQ